MLLYCIVDDIRRGVGWCSDDRHAATIISPAFGIRTEPRASSGYQVLLDGDSATIVIPDKTDLQAASTRLPGTRPVLRLKYSAVRMKLAGSRLWKDITGDELTGGVSNYLNNRDVKRSVNNGGNGRVYFQTVPLSFATS